MIFPRTEVKSANDRYANLETNFLLQRLEHYQGIVIITTNLSENIDQAFQRRMDVVVPCPRCASPRTRLVSQFGSTACKAQYRCDACLGPFDDFKPH